MVNTQISMAYKDSSYVGAASQSRFYGCMLKGIQSSI